MKKRKQKLLSAPEPINLSRYVRRVIKEKNFTVRQVELMSGGRITGGYVNGIMNGTAKNPSIDKLKALAKGLVVSEDEIFRVARGLLPEAREEDPNLIYRMIIELISNSQKNREVMELLYEVARLSPESHSEAVKLLRFLNERKEIEIQSSKIV